MVVLPSSSFHHALLQLIRCPRTVPRPSSLVRSALAPHRRPRLYSTTMSAPSRSDAAAAAAAPLAKSVKLACIQMAAGPDKAANLARARTKVLEAAQAGARIIVLPECFNSPYGCDFFPRYAEPLTPSPPAPDAAPSFHALAAMAAESGAYLVGGSIPELEAPVPSPSPSPSAAAPRYYNTSLVFGPDGALLATFRKIHLFDIDIPGRICFRESDVLSPGNAIVLVDLPDLGRLSVAICYDVRFPELAAAAARRGSFALVIPAAFNTTTGPMHWHLLARTRAVDNQIYVAMCSPARDPAASYQAYGHSLVVDPMGRVQAEAAEAEDIIYCDLDPTVIADTRRSIPVTVQLRFDVYPDVSQGARYRGEEPKDQ